MGQTLTHHFTDIQQQFLDQVRRESYLVEKFYLTGGTALSACYLNHRESEDIDLFTDAPFEESTVIAAVGRIVTHLHAKSTLAKIHERLRYDLSFPKGGLLKIDFVFYDFKHLEPTNILDGLAVDTIGDIAVNKLLALSQRTASKDFVDLYFLLKKYTIWDLRQSVEHKFKLDIDPLYLSALFAKAEDLTDMPIMKKKLSLEVLKKFFLKQAKILAAPLLKP
ncbi:MAG: nucleotidyl transferase AbiEii/AbiGii toxin family protein [Candidatus Gottesmanbacteria bacterium]|nr:nucleotidyl transferase AbiEii/AbiGii toxin family protein [Candidatus Gottesmanbacteria bacterium]